METTYIPNETKHTTLIEAEDGVKLIVAENSEMTAVLYIDIESGKLIARTNFPVSMNDQTAKVAAKVADLTKYGEWVAA
jgi:hypothetical protein